MAHTSMHLVTRYRIEKNGQSWDGTDWSSMDDAFAYRNETEANEDADELRGDVVMFKRLSRIPDYGDL